MQFVLFCTGSDANTEDSRTGFDDDVVPYHTLFTALLKKLEDFRKSDPFLDSGEDSGAKKQAADKLRVDRATQKLNLAKIGSNGGKPITDFPIEVMQFASNENNTCTVSFPQKNALSENSGRSPNFEEFEAILADLKSHPAQPREIRQKFIVHDKQITRLADLSRRFHFAAEFNVSASPASCPPRSKPRCDPKDRYRSIEGVCNNLKEPFRGSFLHPYQRFMPPEYEDGKFATFCNG